jgi:NAD(P)-dependent dehydrogenase (short-subunit alcohol dehydrogenase family)
MTKSGAIELASYVRIVGIAPGFIETPIIWDGKVFLEKLAIQHMRKKLIQLEKVADDVVTFLFSANADAINGQVIPVDDGFLSFKGYYNECTNLSLNLIYYLIQGYFFHSPIYSA